MKNISIIGKFLMIMGLFGLFTLGIALYSASQILKVDTAYSNLINGPSAGALYTTRANRALQSSRAAIGDIMMSRTSELNTRASADLNSQRQKFTSFIDTAISALPTNQALPLIKKEGETLLNVACASAIAAGESTTSADGILAAQALFLKDCQSKFSEVSTKLTEEMVLIVDNATKESEALSVDSARTAVITIGVVVAGLVAVLCGGFFAIRAWLVSPILALSGTMDKLSKGDLSAEVEGTERRDEVGGMAKAVQVFRTNGLRGVQLEQDVEIARKSSEAARVQAAELDQQRAAEMSQATSSLAEGLKRLSAGDLGVRLSQPFAADFEPLRNDFNGAVSQLSNTLGAVSGSAGAIGNGSREISQSTEDLSKRTEQQAASLEETAAALDQITTNVANSNKRAEEARNVAIAANQSARQSGEVVFTAVTAMQRIEQSSNQISNIIGVIDEIAFQTNLLALNAGVEAARAGEAGKGFAVVAQEVRELAQRSAKAAKEIKELIRTSADEVSNGVKLVTATGEALKVIEGHVVMINTQLDAIATSSREQSLGLAEVNTAVNQMDQVTQQNAAMVEESSAASASLAVEAAKLRQLISQFQLGGTQDERPRQPTLAREDHRPAASPARHMIAQVARAVGQGRAAPADTWEDF